MLVDVSKPMWQLNSDGARVSFLVPSLPEAQKICEEIKPDKPYTMEVKLKRKKRSLDANALMWVLLGEMAARIKGQDADSLYRMYVRHSPNYYTVIIDKDKFDRLKTDWEHNGLAWFCDKDDYSYGDKIQARMYYGSSQYDSKQMAALIDGILQDAAAIGIDTGSESFRALCEQYPGGQYV